MSSSPNRSFGAKTKRSSSNNFTQFSSIVSTDLKEFPSLDLLVNSKARTGQDRSQCLAFFPAFVHKPNFAFEALKSEAASYIDFKTTTIPEEDIILGPIESNFIREMIFSVSERPSRP